jgi:DNA modification methylase
MHQTGPIKNYQEMPKLNWKAKNVEILNTGDFVLFNNSYPGGKGYPPGDSMENANRLFLGDNLKVMNHLLPDYEEKINLIYADPPFYTNRLYSARVGQGEDSRRPQEWQLEDGYTDDWPDLESYLDMLYPRLKLMHRLLAEDGTLYLHLDWHANSYARILLDEIFGPERLLNEIVWIYHGPSPIKSAFNRKHDTILVYTKSKEYCFNADEVRQPYDPKTIKTFNSSPKAGFGKMPDLKRGKVPEDWWYFPVVARLHNERTGYPTQKPEALLERIVKASSNPGDLVADFFCGSGTTPVMAELLNRKYIAVDNTWRAIHTTRKRLVSKGAKPFEIRVEKGINLKINQMNSDYQFEFDENSISLDSKYLSEVDYWEVDPDWKGRTFNSVLQALRPRKKKPIRTKIKLPHESNGPRYCIRLVEVKGKQLQTVMKKS